MAKKKIQRELNLSYNIHNIDEVLESINYSELNVERKKEGENWVEYLDIIASFDIETSSFDYNNEKLSNMYIWMLNLEGKTVIGRTWEEFIETIDKIVDYYNLFEYRRIIVYVHNLSYEFQFLQHYFNWFNVFSREVRKPMKAVTTNGIEFRCSYILAGCNLDNVGKNLTKYKVNKLVGNLDYSLLRGNITELDEKELQYCINDVLVVVAYIKEQRDYYGGLAKLPLTNTGRVRKLCKEKCFSKENGEKYKKLMSKLTLTLDEYELLNHCFQGGFTHANWLYSGDIVENVKSFDFTSSYPTQLLANPYPMSKGEVVEDIKIEEIEKGLNLYAYMFNVIITNIRPKVDHDFEHYISKSKCWSSKNVIEDNGRVRSADEIFTTITNIDWEIIRKFYDYDEVLIGDCYRYNLGWLPTPFVETIVELYEKKTTLKGVEGMELEYQLSKGMLNSCYGMACMSVISDEITYENDEWKTLKANPQDCIDKYNDDSSRFLFYPWAVWCTALSRYALFTGIEACGSDYLYADTDSIKVKNYEQHMDYINEYNEFIIKRLDEAMEFHKIDKERLRPKTIKGEPKQLGVWDDEYENGVEMFKTLGAKRYLMQVDGHVKPTVAGINKKNLQKYLEMQDNAFEFFEDYMFVPKEYSGKTTASYFDTTREGIIMDYKGNLFKFKELSGVNLSVSDYQLSLSENYRTLLNIREEVMY